MKHLMTTYVEVEFPGLDAASSAGIVLQTLGQAVERFELLIVLLVLHLDGWRDWFEIRSIVLGPILRLNVKWKRGNVKITLDMTKCSIKWRALKRERKDMNDLTYTTQDDLLLLGVQQGMGVMGNFVAFGLDLVPGSFVGVLLKQ